MNISITLRRSVVAVAALGLVFATTAFAANGNPPYATNESWSSCTSTLCIDAPPGPNGEDGSGGWGFGTNAPITSLTVGVNANLTVTAMQTSPCADATITLTYSSHDFTYVINGDTSATCTNPFDRGGVETCSYTDFAHTDKSDSFTFTPQNPTNTALITATVDACGQQASETFPVAIVAPKT
jgi:hypothetical protein